MEILKTCIFYACWIGAVACLAISGVKAWVFMRRGDVLDKQSSTVAFVMSFGFLAVLKIWDSLFASGSASRIFQDGFETMYFLGLSYKMGLAAFPGLFLLHIFALVFRPIPMEGAKWNWF